MLPLGCTVNPLEREKKVVNSLNKYARLKRQCKIDNVIQRKESKL